MSITPPRLGRGFIEPHAPDRWAGVDDREAVIRWQSLVDRRLIGTTAPLAAPVLASVRAAEAVLVRRRRAVGEDRR